MASLDATEVFYAGILELPIQRALTVFGAPGHLIMSHGNGQVIFIEEGDVIRTHPSLNDRLCCFPKGVGVTLHFRVEEIGEIYEALLEEGMEILYPLEVKPYGLKELWCFDPDGYLVVLEEPWK